MKSKSKTAQETTAQEIFNLLGKEDFSSCHGTMYLDFMDIILKINDKSPVGYIMQSWLGAWLRRKDIYFREPTNSQEFPDFLLKKDSDTDGLLEFKSFDLDADPNFDIANFESYCGSLQTKASRLDADYLIFGYTLRDTKLKIEKIWLKKIWEISCPSGEYPVKIQQKRKMIEKMDIVDAVMADRVTAFSFPQPEELKSPLITLEDVSAGYVPGKPVLSNLDLRIDMDDRIALLGANGNGKSTLVKLIADRLDPFAGDIHKSGKLRVGYFAQFQTDELDVKATPFEVMQDAKKGVPEPKIRASLGKFGFDKGKADTKIAKLSGGEKARLLFCLMSVDAPHIMLLDEPTNHLDIDAREALTQALNNYEGAVILVSHDPHLVECVADRLWLVADGTCKPYLDDLEAYKVQVIEQRKRERKQEKQNSKKAGKKGSKNNSNNSEKLADRLEQEITEITEKKDVIENDMANVANLATSNQTNELLDLQKTYDELSAQLALKEQELEACINKM